MKSSKKPLNLILLLLFTGFSFFKTNLTYASNSENPAKINPKKVFRAGAAKEQTTAKVIDYLTKFELRPSPRDIISAFNGQLPAINPFISEDESIISDEDGYSYDLDAIQEKVQQIKRNGPKAIARMERAYPGASYFPTGRDGAIFGDALEFFYDLLGQHDRVYRLFASGPTVHALNTSTGPDFLESNGLGKRINYPVVFVDNTSWTRSSQTYKLSQYAVQYLQNKGIEQSKIKSLVTTASVDSGWEPSSDSQELKQQIEDNFLEYPLYIDPSNEMVDIFYAGGFWHPSMKSSTRTLSDGRIVGTFNRAFSKENKRLALAFIYEMMKVVSDPSFLEDVQREAEELGFNFTGQIGAAGLNFKKVSPKKALEIAIDRKNNYIESQIRLQIFAQITADTESFLENSQLSEKEVEKITNLVNLIISEKEILSLKDSVKKITMQKKSIEHLDQAIVESVRRVLPSNVSLTNKLSFIISRLPKNELEHEKYFSDNGRFIHDWLEVLGNVVQSNNTNKLFSTAKNAVQELSQELANILTLITEAYNNETISKKDFRRLALQIFAYASNIKDLSPIGQTISSQVSLKKMLENKYEVFLTSEKYDSQARKTYEKLIKLQYLPKTELSCEELLKNKESAA